MNNFDSEAIALKEKAQQDSDGAHEKYRSAGFGISAGVITLSSGLLYFGLNKSVPILNTDVFALPIILSFLQQVANYFAAHSEARSLSEASVMAVITAYPHFKYDITPHALERYFLFQRQNRLYTVSDWLCVAAVGTFVVICDAAVFYLGPLWVGWVVSIVSIGSIIAICRPYVVEYFEKRNFRKKNPITGAGSINYSGNVGKTS